MNQPHPQRRDEEVVVVEVRAAEGGQDAKDLVVVQVGLYREVATRREL
jgi:protein subunit release factor A